MGAVSAFGDWDYSNYSYPAPYGKSPVYDIGLDMLADCGVVEDWGCGLGWFRETAGERLKVITLDGSASKFADRVVDLAEYRSSVPGVFMRGVLEHNRCWRRILENARDSFTRKLVLAMYIRPTEGDEEINLYAERRGYKHIGLQIPLRSILEVLGGLSIKQTSHLSDTEFGCETVFEVTK